jgi:hypothetical protein
VLAAIESQNKDKPKPIQFAEQKNTVAEMRAVLKNWQRKIEISELEAKKARAILKKHRMMEMDQGYYER